MRPTRTGGRWLSAAVGLLVLATAGCATGSAPGDGRSSTTAPRAAPAVPADSKPITWAYKTEPTSYNANTLEGATLPNFVVLNNVLLGFTTFRPDGTVQPNTDFGTVTKLSDKPLTVRYEINPRAVWSDGVPIDCDDIALAWLANSGVTGPKGFSSSGTVGYQDMNAPTCTGPKTAVIVYRKPFADWRTTFSPGTAVPLPAHLVESRAGMSRKISDYLTDPRSPDLARAIAFYNKGWTLEPGRVDKSLTLGSGPYLLDSWTAGQSLTLRANPRWWGTPPLTDTVIIRFIPSSQQAQALANGEIQIMDPSATIDIVRQVQALGDLATVSQSDRFSFSHLDFSFRGQFKDATLRKAFALCVPRQDIVDKLLKPIDPGAAVLQSRFVMPFQPAYPQFATGVGGQKYDTVDIAGAHALLAGRRPTVRLGWSKTPNGADHTTANAVALIQQSCDKAGFRVVDGGSATFLDKEWVAGNFDIALFAWSGSPAVAGDSDIYTTKGESNVTGYSNPRLDGLFQQLGEELDPGRQVSLLMQIDSQLWSDVATIPLYSNVSMLVTSKDVQGVEGNPTQADVTWSMPRWLRN